MNRRILAAVVLAWGVSCGRQDPPPPALPPPPPAAPPVVNRPAEPRASFEGTWLTDQGALVIEESKSSHFTYSGVFLPFDHPSAYFWAPEEAMLEFRGLDGRLRWQASLTLSEQGRRIEGRVWLLDALERLPCRGRRIGSASRSGVPALLEALADEDPWIRRSAVDALGALGPAAAEAIPAVVRAVGDRDVDVSRHAAVALPRLGLASASAVQALCCALKDPDPRVRSKAADALGGLGVAGAAAIADLAALVEDGDASAAAALIQIGRAVPAAVRKIFEGSDSPFARGVLGALRPTSPLAERPGEDWPQWRGLRKDNVSRETGLLREWPRQGPPLVWEMWGVGSGIAAPAVRDGRVYVLGYVCGWEYLAALSLETGQCLWTAKLGRGHLENSHMRWVAQRTPTATADRVYAYLDSGTLVCLHARDGVEEWRLDYLKEFGGRNQNWGFADHPFIDEGRLICTPASEKATIAAVDPATGKVIWKTLYCVGEASSPSTITATVGGVREFVVFAGNLIGFAASDGRPLWRTDELNATGWMVQTPMRYGEDSFLVRTRDWNRMALIRTPVSGIVQPVYVRKQRFGWLGDSSLVIGSFVYVPAGSAIERVSVDPDGESRLVLEHKAGNDSSMTCADGCLYVLGTAGKMVLIDLTGEGMDLRSTFEIPMFEKSSGTTNPVVARGRLLVRDNDRLLCYDVRQGGAPGERTSRALERPEAPGGAAPPAAFVPTPRDVVERMLALAQVKASEVVVDLGSGDGRILLAAAKSFGAKAVGYEIDDELVKKSRGLAKEAGLSERVRIEQQDLFTADLSGADVVALYLPEELLTRLRPQLEKLRPGARVVSHQFKIPGVTPDQEAWVESTEDGGRHAVYLWKAPLRKAGAR